MLSFRKTFLLLAAVALLAGAALAQPITCMASSGVPPILRAEATADEVGQVSIICTGGAVTTTVGDITTYINVQVWLNTNITSKLINSSWSEALLLVDDPQPAAQRFCNNSGSHYVSASDTCKATVTATEQGPTLFNLAGGTNPNAFAGRKVTDNSIAFLGIPFDPPGTGQRILRMVNIRANASALAPPSGNIIPLNVTMYISITGTGSLNLQNTTINVGYVQYGLGFDVRNAKNDDSGAPTFSQCSPNNGKLGDDRPKGCPDFRLRFSEKFSTAFRTAPAVSTANAQNVPNTIYNTEHMFAVDPANTANDGSGSGSSWRGTFGSRGWATQGTRLIARFKDIPAAVDVYVTSQELSSTGKLAADLIGTDGAGQGNTGLSASSAALSSGCDAVAAGSSARVPSTYAPVLYPLFTDPNTGIKYAVWEVNIADASRIEDITFGVAVRTRNSASAQSGLGTVTVTGNYAPVPSTDPTSDQASKWAQMSSSYPVPRFVENPISATTFKINPCRTNLLFPYVTQNTTGAQLWDTGIAVANTLKDPFSTVAQQGKCTVFYYTSPDLVAPASQTTNADVRAGDTVLFSLYAGGNFGIQPVKDFTGYIIVQCNFQGAHGYAFVSDLGATRVAEGYLGLVMDQSTQVRGKSANGTGAKSEVLTH